MEKVRLEEAIRRYGFRRTCREAGISLTTLDTAIRGARVPKETTAKKIANALGVGVDEIEWPIGYGERLPGGVLRLHGQIDEMPRVSRRDPFSDDDGARVVVDGGDTREQKEGRTA